MVAHLTRYFAIAMLGALAAPVAHGSALPDPTAPPARAVATPAASPTEATLALTAIKLSRGQKLAVIDGRELAVGERYQDARIVRIDENQVILRRGRELTVLSLYPDVEKKVRRK